MTDARPLYALTLWRPWPWAILHAGKRIENRPWPAPPWLIGRTLALHAGKQWDPDGAMYIDTLLMPRTSFPRRPIGGEHPGGVVVGLARVVDCTQDRAVAERMFQGLWFFGPFGWILEEVRALGEPVPCRGRQKLWRVPNDALLAIRAQDGAA